MMKKLEYQLKQTDTSVLIVGDSQTITFDLSAPSDLIEDDGVFAAWALLPIAMIAGRDFHINARGDRETERNVAQLSNVWSNWLPDVFRPVSVTFSRYSLPRSAGEEDLHLFSGGVDSCHNLLRRYEAGQRQAVLTVHGMDYSLKANDAFHALMKKTEPLISRVATRRITARTDCPVIYRHHGLHADISHGFTLAAALFLARGQHRSGEIASDYSRYQEFTVFPWGTNSVTNALFASSDFRMNTGSLDLTRAQKLATIAQSPEALAALTFCQDMSVRPRNCGICEKCMRTKAMFAAVTGDVPDLFIDRSLRKGMLRTLDLSKRSERAFFIDLVDSARRHGNMHLIPGLADKAARKLGQKRDEAFSRFLARMKKSILKRAARLP